MKVYGADWCPITQTTLEHLKARGVAYAYIDVENDDAGSAWVKQHNGGKEKKPTIQVGDEILTEPDNIELDEALRRQRLIAE